MIKLRPTEDRKKEANITHFINNINKQFNLGIKSYPDLFEWSIENVEDFWAAVWELVDIKAFHRYGSVIEDLTKFPGTKWFPGAKLTFAENLLKYKDNQTALIFKDETRKNERLTYAELYDVARLAKSLRKLGVVPG